MSRLVLVRHGESRWNLSNRFTGWVDVPLSENGVREAVQTAKDLQAIDFDVAYSSRLERAQSTLIIILSQQDRTGVFLHDEDPGQAYYRWTKVSNRRNNHEIPIHTHTALNERFYGTLQGMNKKEAVKKYGKERVFHWRRGFSDRPPHGESLEDVTKRVIPYLKATALKDLRKNRDVLVTAHGNTLRAIIMHLEGITPEEVPFLDLPKGRPISYRFARGKLRREDGGLSFNRPLR